MKQRWAALLIASVLLSLMVVFSQDDTTSNLLDNGDFEGDFVKLAGAVPRNVAKSWTPWHIPPGESSPSFANHDPNYDEETERLRLDETGSAQKYFTLFATHQGGIYQQVDSLTSGTTYRFSVYAYVWSSSFEDIDVSEDPGAVVVRVGIDPKGGTDGASADIIWSSAATFFYDAYRQYAVIATAESSTITVFVESTVGEPRANNYIYLDDAVLEIANDSATEATPTSETNTGLASATPSPAATATSSDTPTPTPSPTATSTATDTASPTATPITPTADPGAGVASEQSSTATPTATLRTSESNIASPTPSPTETPSPTPTPTSTPTATATPTPMPTPTATATATAPATATTAATPSPSPTASAATPIGEELPDTVTHTVVKGDTVSALALHYGSTIQAINTANGLNASNVIYIGQILIIPVNLPEPPADATATTTQAPSATPTMTPTFTATPIPTATPITYQIQPGDTLDAIARRYGTTVNALAELNGIFNPHQIDVGQILVIPTPAPTATPLPTITPIPTATPYSGAETSGTITYIVQAGDMLSAIAAAYNTTVAAIAQLNGITNPSRIYVGQALQIPSADGGAQAQSVQAQTAPTSVPTPTPLPTSARVAYTVQSGDTLYSIAGYYGVSIVELAQLNGLVDSDQLSVGQVLLIPG